MILFQFAFALVGLLFGATTAGARVSVPLLPAAGNSTKSRELGRKLQSGIYMINFYGNSNPEDSGATATMLLQGDTTGTLSWYLFEEDCTTNSIYVTGVDAGGSLSAATIQGGNPSYVANEVYYIDLNLVSLYDYLRGIQSNNYRFCCRATLSDINANYVDHEFFKVDIELRVVDHTVNSDQRVDDTDFVAIIGFAKNNPVYAELLDHNGNALGLNPSFRSNVPITFDISVPPDTKIFEDTLSIYLVSSHGTVPFIPESPTGNLFSPTLVLSQDGGAEFDFTVPDEWMYNFPFGEVSMTIHGSFDLDDNVPAARRLQDDFAGTRQSFSIPLIIKNPRETNLSPAAYGGIVFAMTFVIGIAVVFAYAAHKRRSNPQVYPTKKANDAKTLKTCTTISSFGSERSLDSNIRHVPVGASASRRDIESQQHAVRSQRSMQTPTRANQSQRSITKDQRRTKPSKATALVNGSDRRPRSHGDVPSSSGSQRNIKDHRISSPRTATGGESNYKGKPKPSTRPGSRDLHRPRSQVSTSPKHHRNDRKPKPKHHPSNEESA